MADDTTPEELPVVPVHPTMLTELPDDIVTDILSRLPVKTVVRSTSVSKKWYSLIKTTSFITMHLGRSISKLAAVDVASGPQTSDSFILLTSTDNEPRCSIFYDDENFTLHSTVKIPFESESKSVRIVGSCNGLLCLTNADVSCGWEVHLYNPALQEYRKLSHELSCFVDLMGYVDHPVLGFGYNEVEKDYTVVRILYSLTDGLQKFPPRAEVYGLREQKWRSIKVQMDCIALSGYGVFVHGCFYWLASDKTLVLAKCLVSFDFRNEVFCEIKMPEECCGKDYFKDYFPSALARWNESVCLMVVRLQNKHRKFTECVFWQLKKDDDGEISWKKQLHVLPKGIPCLPLGFTWTGKLVVTAIDTTKRFATISKTAILNLANMKLKKLAEDGPHTIASPFLESLVLFLE